MGATSSKSASSSSSGLPAEHKLTAAVPAKKPKDTAASTTVASVELMIALITAHVPQDVGLSIIMGYITIPSLRETSPFDTDNPKEFFKSRPQYTFFHYNLSDLADADQYMIWGIRKDVDTLSGRPIGIEPILEGNLNPLLLTTSIDGEDHRGPGFIPSGTLFERALYVEDVFIKEEKSKETMSDMLKRYVIKRCGEEEFKRQVERAHQVMEVESKKKTAMEADDLTALNRVWNILKNADEKKLERNEALKTAIATFQDQLRQSGNDKIIQEALKLFDRDYSELGDYNSPKNNLAANQIIGLAQLMRLPVCDLQTSFTGLYNVLNDEKDKVIVNRIDVRRKLGVLAGSTSSNRLGSNCHLDYIGCFDARSAWGRFAGIGRIDAVFWKDYVEQKHLATKNYAAIGQSIKPRVCDLSSRP